jgi:ADP-ribose pyrophosphatase
MEKKYEILDEESVYRGFFNLTRVTLRHTLFRGGWSEPLIREVLHRGRCVAVVPYDPVRDQVILIEQFRIGAVGDKSEPWLLEIVAGAIEPGESPEAVACREVEEEAGCQLQQLIRIGEFYTTPGGYAEKITLFCGILDTRGAGGLFGLPEEHEDIRASVVPLDEALAWVEAGVIDSAAPIVALQWLALNRERLQRERT